MRRVVGALVLLALLALAGCSAPTAGDVRADPVVDRPGWEDGYWHDDPLPVNETDGLDADERAAVTARAKARIEHLRDAEFEEPVTVEVISREQYREEYAPGGDGDAWTDQTWRALFLVGGEETAAEAVGETLSTTVQGFYDPREGHIVVVSDERPPTVDRRVLVHELVHALQDQRLNLGTNPPTRDARLAQQGVVEGDANYVQRLYDRRCGGQWECIDRPERVGGGGAAADAGVFLAVYAPYAVGPVFVADVRDRGGWSAVNRLYEDYPESTEQVIHPERYPGVEPAAVEVPDRSTADWERFDRTPEGNTVGEAGVYAMLYATGRLDRQGVDLYSYDHPVSDGWAGDSLVPYRTVDGDREYGYVWTTTWKSRDDARAFETAYRELLTERADDGASADTYRVPASDPFAGAYRVTREGRRVTVVHGPSTDALAGIHPGADG